MRKLELVDRCLGYLAVSTSVIVTDPFAFRFSISNGSPGPQPVTTSRIAAITTSVSIVFMVTPFKSGLFLSRTLARNA